MERERREGRRKAEGWGSYSSRQVRRTFQMRELLQCMAGQEAGGMLRGRLIESEGAVDLVWKEVRQK